MTAKNFIKSGLYITKDGSNDVHDSVENVESLLIEFATYHVTKALEEAANNADFSVLPIKRGTEITIDVQSILKSYPTNNIL